ncbi:MAG: MltA domain-containing protein [Pseudomonadota bacterium]|nr:MltA domain-containing protein [Pseudomonadota bacterium]
MKHPYKNVCDKYEENDFKRFKRDFLENFELENTTESKRKTVGKLTGYYEPEIKAFSYPKKGSYPIYKHPSKSETKINAEVTRKKINEGYLDDHNLEIAWVENEIEAFFLHIQGSGRLQLENNKTIKVRYAGSNKKRYTSLGKILIQKGHISKKNVDMYKIKKWLYKNKNKSREFLNMNQRYIFFEKYSGNIKGSSGMELVPYISVATDKRFIKKGETIIIQSADNRKEIFIGIAHDEGAAIKGENRIDLFSGHGDKAERIAAKLNKKIFVRKLIPKK